VEFAPEKRVSEEGRNFWSSPLKSASPRRKGILEFAPEERTSEEERNFRVRP